MALTAFSPERFCSLKSSTCKAPACFIACHDQPVKSRLQTRRIVTGCVTGPSFQGEKRCLKSLGMYQPPKFIGIPPTSFDSKQTEPSLDQLLGLPG